MLLQFKMWFKIIIKLNPGLLCIFVGLRNLTQIFVITYRYDYKIIN